MFKLEAEQLKLLHETLSNHRPDLLWVINNLEKIDENIGNEIRDAINDEFLKSGIGIGDKPNTRGLQLENLIDQIGRIFM